ncbi:Pleiotropic drug resistance protein 1 [Capsicum baccatum]|uniref:Pleiotropic drug resistance protein 1 n=1 Tax=Capsicum baccatum TaxID=33114 RepID=A0A2G2V6N4_CAPBA|nr:Pleiotropic drug resistance protein 1 [Capsicum baccatum]
MTVGQEKNFTNLSKFPHGHSKKVHAKKSGRDSNRDISVLVLIRTIRRLTKDKVQMASEVSSMLRNQVAERASAKEESNILQAELDLRTRRLETEKNELQSVLEKELDRRSSNWSLKLEKYQIEQHRLRERARELVEQNVSLQREENYLEKVKELKSENLLTTVLREKLYSEEMDIKQLQADLAAAVRGNDILKCEVQNVLDALFCATPKLKYLELQVLKKDENINQLTNDLQECMKELGVVKGILPKVFQERDFMWEEVKSYSEMNMLLNYEINMLKRKEFAEAYKSFHVGEKLANELATPYDESKSHPAALSTKKYCIGMKQMFKACAEREFLLMKRSAFVYILKMFQIVQTVLPSRTSTPDGIGIVQIHWRWESLAYNLDHLHRFYYLYFLELYSLEEIKYQASTEDRLVLLKGVSGDFRPVVLIASMGVSGAGKTTLMDVLAGRKTGGYVNGDIKIAGYPKKQETFVEKMKKRMRRTLKNVKILDGFCNLFWDIFEIDNTMKLMS